MSTEVYKLVKQSIIEILDYLKANPTNSIIPKIRKTKLEIKRSNDSVTITPTEIFEPVNVYIKDLEEVLSKELPKTRGCIFEMIKDEIFKYQPLSDNEGHPVQITSPSEIGLFEYNLTISDFLYNYFQIAGSFDWDEKVFENVYAHFEKLKETKEIIETAFIPLIGFQMDSVRFQISKDFSIEKITDEDFQYINSFNDRDMYVQENRNLGVFSKIQFKLFKKYKYLRAINENETQNNKNEAIKVVVNDFKSVITALRLTSAGNIRPFSIFFNEYPVSPYKFWRIYNLQPTHLDFEYFPGSVSFADYIFNKECQQDFLIVFNKITDVKLTKELEGLRLGLEKFFQSFSRLSFEDKILDYSTILDSTLLFDERNSNFYQLSVRCSLLLANDKKINAFKLSTFMIGLRNDIIHKAGISNKKMKKDLIRYENKDYTKSEYIVLCESIIRKILHEYLSRIEINIGIDSINKDLENKICGK